jgi:hypothetical protein
VTALRKLGLPAETGELAILAHTTSLTGTELPLLASALQKRYGPQGLVVEFRGFKDVAELKQAGLTLTSLKFSALADHCVTILGVETNRVIVGDPLGGLTSIPTEEFESNWRFVGIVLKRTERRTQN